MMNRPSHSVWSPTACGAGQAALKAVVSWPFLGA